MKKFVIAITIIAVVATAAQAGKNKDNAGGPPPGVRKAAMQGQLLPPQAVEMLQLTADQKTKFDELNAAFQKDLEAWQQAHPNFHADLQKAREAQDKEAMQKLVAERKPVMEARKKYMEQFKVTLTDEQKAKLEAMKEKLGAHRGPKHGDKAAKPN
jgi:Spy/CpxP family protein refolding chaperone